MKNEILIVIALTLLSVLSMILGRYEASAIYILALIIFLK